MAALDSRSSSPATGLVSAVSDVIHPLRAFAGSISNILPSAVTTADLNSTLNIAASLAAACAATATLVSIYKTAVRRRALTFLRSNEYPPGPAPFPLLGNIPSLQASYHKTLHEYSNEPISIFWILSTPFIVVNEEKGLRSVLGGSGGLYEKPRYFGYRSRTIQSSVDAEKEAVASESVQYDPNADSSRVALEQMVRDAFPNIKDAAQGILKSLEVSSGDDSIHQIRRAFVALNLKTLFGVTVGEGPSDESSARIADMIEFAGVEFARRMVNPFRPWLNPFSHLRFIRDVFALIRLGTRLSRALDKAVINAAESDEEASSGVGWVHAWIGKVGVVKKLGKVVGLLMASTQTVPLTATWALHLVARHAAVHERLRQELRDEGISSITDLSYDNMQKLQYLDGVVKETLRLFPPFPLLQRQAQEDNILCGVRIPAGTVVYIVPWLVHRSEKFWFQPHAFDPERFVRGSPQHGDCESAWLYIPFGRGSRMCAGSKLAMVELKVLVASAVLGFEWTSESRGIDCDEQFPPLGMAPSGILLKTKASTDV